MQAITVAIGKAGINFFAQELIAAELINSLSSLTPPGKNIPIGGFNIDYSSVANLVINLTNGTLLNFDPVFQSISQQDGGVFPLCIEANNFSAQYNWEETYVWTLCWGGPYPGCDNPENKDNKFTYRPGFNNFVVTINLQFQYNSQNQDWEISVQSVNPNTPNASPNIPSGSILQQQDQGCFTSHLDDVTASAISAIDFATPVTNLINGMIASIPGSGDLGNGIVYDFSLGDSGLLFPDNDGIQMGVKGGASYNGAPFSGDTPPSLSLPLPPSDADAHHLNMYVSNYEVDALNWAYFEAGKLNLLITPQDLDDPQLLDVSTYTSYESALEPYSAFVMNAQITQNSAPVTSFQTAYIYTSDVMTLLKSQLPTNIYNLIQALPSNAYLSQADVDAFLTKATVPNQYFATIENAGKVAAMVLTQDISYTLLIQNNDNPPPNIKFSTKRIDVLTNLGLGISSNNAQTLQFGFANALNSTTYDSSTIAGFDGVIFEAIVWAIAEGLYAENLADLGKTGVPLPIMQNFQFDFENAELSIQNGYVSILASVLYKS
jgi:hypothetical protein